MKDLLQQVDWVDVLALIGLIFMGAAIYRATDLTGLIAYIGALFCVASLTLSYKQGRGE